MTTPRSVGATLVLALVVTAGCGTLHNIGGRTGLAGPATDAPPAVFGGVKHDVGEIREVFKPTGPSDRKELDPIIATTLYTLDLPLSLVGDVVTLPAVLWESSQAKKSETTAASPPPAAPPKTPEPEKAKRYTSYQHMLMDGPGWALKPDTEEFGPPKTP